MNSITATMLGAAAALFAAPAASHAEPAPQQAFWDALASHCGKAYAGELASEDERDADWRGRAMVAHWAQCDADRIAIAFHVADAQRSDGWDRSRTWLVTRTEAGLLLKHDHRHDDGEADAMTFYGGDTADHGSAEAQDFPVDAESIALFEAGGLAASLTNVWRIEVTPAGSEGATFTYQLTGRNDPTRRFRVTFDASEAVEAPPPAWGW